MSLVESLFLQKHPLQDFLSSLNAVISTNESTEFITSHVILNLAYTYKFQLKTTIHCLCFHWNQTCLDYLLAPVISSSLHV